MNTKRISLVKPSLDYLPEVLSAIQESRSELEEYLVWVKDALNDPEQNMSRAIANHENFTDELRYFIRDRNTSVIVGTIGLIIRDLTVPFFELGYWVRTSEVGKGYATEAVGVLENYAFTELKAQRLEIRMAKSNVKSQSVAKRAGYALEADLQNERRLPGGSLENTLVYVKFGL